MWIYLNNAFLSIVADIGDADRLLVRARFAGDIERVFAEADVAETPYADYRFRARLPRQRVAAVLALAATTMTATNFKASVTSDWRHDAYLGVWSVMRSAQTERARSLVRPEPGRS